jgi:hypothetical protein
MPPRIFSDSGLLLGAAGKLVNEACGCAGEEAERILSAGNRRTTDEKKPPAGLNGVPGAGRARGAVRKNRDYSATASCAAPE